MKKLILSTAICFGLLLTTTVSAQKKTHSKEAQKEQQMFLENESKYNFAETIEKLNAEIANKGWRVSTVHDLQKSLKKEGTDVLPIQVLALCQPEYAKKILLKDDERIVSALMPCRVSIYEKSNGKTYISRINAAIMPPSMTETIKEVMGKASNDIEEILVTVTK